MRAAVCKRGPGAEQGGASRSLPLFLPGLLLLSLLAAPGCGGDPTGTAASSSPGSAPYVPETFSEEEVARILQESMAFMAFGHPEGFGLPIAEALACGCCVVGYSGLGGRELMSLGAEHGVALEVAYGDWQGFVDAFYALSGSLSKKPLDLQHALLGCSKDLRRSYSSDMFRTSVEEAMLRWEKCWSAHMP